MIDSWTFKPHRKLLSMKSGACHEALIQLPSFKYIKTQGMYEEMSVFIRINKTQVKYVHIALHRKLTLMRFN